MCCIEFWSYMSYGIKECYLEVHIMYKLRSYAMGSGKNNNFGLDMEVYV
jgi:hypothetical protein